MSDWIKVFKVAPHVVLLAVNEAARGVDSCAVRLEGRVFGAKGEAMKLFPTPAAAAEFFDAYDQEAAEAWWRELNARWSRSSRGMPIGCCTALAVLLRWG